MMRVLLPLEPSRFVVMDSKGKSINNVKASWDTSSHTYFLQFENDPEGVHVKLDW
ncbi:hypothetical protein [Olivibacter sp. XZL3]|uniref:hypothetical protein n=1 Tax=Olivibacter sp. XZL3 TaxID=1735116 RepID=UPI00197FFC06|nr:hypothetical protein [Olivibacter sp. XZL3]